MKKFRILATLVLVSQIVLPMSGFAQTKSDRIVKTLKKSSESTTLEIEKDTFIFNIQGYGCQWPGLLVSNHLTQAELNHNWPFTRIGSDKYNLAMGIKDPNYQFCSLHTAEDVFGPEFVIGANLPIKIDRVLDLRARDTISVDDKSVVTQYIRETITIQINGRIVESVAEINLD